MNRTSSSAGGVFFYIFLGIALFAALSFAVANMMRTSSGADVNKELRHVQASEIVQAATAMRTALRTMDIGGTDETEISFDNPAVAGYGHTPAETDNQKLFHVSGGGLSYAPPLEEWLDPARAGSAGYRQWIFSGANEVTGVGTDGDLGGGSSELLAILPWLNRDLCLKLNDILSVSNPGGLPPQDAGNIDLAAKFTGTYAASQAIGGDAAIDGKRAGCVRGGGTPPADSYHFFQVLLAR